MKNLISILVLVIIILILSMTNPSKEEHQKVLRNDYEELVSELINDKSLNNVVSEDKEVKVEAEVLVKSLIIISKENFIKNAVLKYNDYFIFSTLEMKLSTDKFEVVTYGLLNKCISIDEDESLLDYFRNELSKFEKNL